MKSKNRFPTGADMKKPPLRFKKRPVSLALNNAWSSAGEIIERPIDELKPDPNNPRTHSKTQIKKISRSIKQFGFISPVIIDVQGRIIAGHGRIRAAKLLGWKRVPTLCIEHLTPEEAKAYQIADNRLTELATWDRQLLGVVLKDLTDLKIDFDVELTGFDMGEIDLLVQEAGMAQEGANDPDDDVPTAECAPVTKLGDLWQLGKNFLLCADATKEASFAALLRGKVAELVFIDPPYNVKIPNNVSGLGKIKHRNFVMASGEMSSEEYTKFLGQAISLLVRYSAKGAIHYICMDWRHLKELLAAGESAGSELLNLCVWVKHNAGMGSLYRSQHELVAVFKHGKTPHRNNILLGKFGRNRSNVWNYAGATSPSHSGDEGNLLALHSTPKPVALVMDAILDCSARGDIVLDAFLGSGTSLIAAERSGRVCYGMELDPLYVDTAVRRWMKYTGDRARHAVTGRYFDEPEMAKKGGRHS
jgi:DNA modification methylase